MSTSSSNNYDYSYSSSSSDEDSRASVAKSKAKTTHDEGENPSVPLNDRRVTYAELLKRKAEDDEAEDRQRRKDRIRRKILAAEERRRFVDGVPSDSDADASEEETTWVLPEHKIKPDRHTREFQKTMKQIEVEAEAEEDSDSDSDDPYIHPNFINGPDGDSDEEEDSEKDSDDESDKSDESDERNFDCHTFQSKHELEASISDNQKNPSSHTLRPKRTVRVPARYRSDHVEAGSSADVRVVVDDRRRRNGKSVTVVEVEDSSHRVCEDSAESVEAGDRAHAREYPTVGLLFEAPIINTFPDN
ncbi:nucleolin 1-like [Papaver somniferum]|uniref:nucleolin 1-like n=1 Tax=Papaver somniferum TaxID=3469 RepID=UPI000E6FC0B0|nr:nucleolin 1-like [Papaver somniferum]